MTARLLGPRDEPQQSGAVVAVHFGDYRLQEIWVRSGSDIGTWLPLGGQWGRPKVWIDDRTSMAKLMHHGPEPRPGPGEVPQYPHWEDVLARGPVSLLVAADAEPYNAGWRAGRRDLWHAMEEVAEEDPREVATDD